MNKILSIILMLISFILFIGLILIAIYYNELPEYMHIIGFFIVGYLSLILFTIGVFKFYKTIKKESN